MTIATTFLMGYVLFGVLIGSFLNVVVYRFHTGRSLSGRSHCTSCGHTLSWYELIPVFSFIALRGRCRACLSHIPVRYMVVELLTGLLFGIVYLQSADIFSLVFHTLLMALLVVILVYDVRHTVIPDIFVVLLVPLSLVLFLIQSEGFLWGSVLTNIMSGCAASGFFAGLWLVSRGRWIGLGDAKLALPLGFLVGFPGAFSLVVLAFWIGAILSIVFLAYMRVGKAVFERGKLGLAFLTRPLTMKSEVPFAPFLIASFLLVYFFGIDVFSILERAILLY